MNATTSVHPDAVLESLLSKGGRAQRLRNLKAVNETCRKHHEGGQRDFSIPVIGKLCENADLLKARSLYNAQSSDYVALIVAWAAYSGPSVPTGPKAPNVLASNEYLMRIEDPAIRAIMQATIVERDKLKAQINTIKANARVVVDRRPLGANVVTAPGSRPAVVLTTEAQLTDSERKALRIAISREFFEDHGWQEAAHGEVVTESGRTIFDPGFTTAIRKILGGIY
jgi:hypothetical protein